MTDVKTLALHDIVEKSENFIESQVDGETILMHLDEGSFSSLKSTGLRIWELIDGETSIAEICSALQETFEVDQAECEQQTLTFIEELCGRSLIKLKG